MYDQELKQKERLKEFIPVIKLLDLSKYGYAYESGPVTEWLGEISGNINIYTWKQQNGPLNFKLTVFARFREGNVLGSTDSLTASISDESDGYRFMHFNSFEKEKNHPLQEASENNGNKPIEEFANNYLKVLTQALDTYLNDFITGKRFIQTELDRGDY